MKDLDNIIKCATNTMRNSKRDDNGMIKISPLVLYDLINAVMQKDDPRGTALIGLLAAKLACHAPDDSAVQWALEWLEGRG